MVWDVGPDDVASEVPQTVADIAERVSPGLASKGDGLRAFVNGRRVELSHPVEAGDRVELFPVRQPRDGEVEILAQRHGVLLVSKPAGLPTEATKLGDESLVSKLIERLKGGTVHAASRLDTMVSGVAVCTLGSDAARRIAYWREKRQLTRRYLALGLGTLSEAEGSWTWPLGKGRDRGGRHLARSGVKGAKPAVTRYRVIAESHGVSWLELTPETGRMHQLRCHAQLAGVPLLGDQRYGGPKQLVAADGRVLSLGRIALHCERVFFPAVSATLPWPADLNAWWLAAGGDEAAAG